MEWLNYHHLLYFWTVAREGGLVPAGRVLRLSHPTLSAQIRALEARLGETPGLESLRVELRGSGVKVVTIAPGFVQTTLSFQPL